MLFSPRLILALCIFLLITGCITESKGLKKSVRVQVKTQDVVQEATVVQGTVLEVPTDAAASQPLASEVLPAEECDKVVKSMQWLRTASATQDASKAIKQKRYNYKMINGFRMSLLGVPDEVSEYIFSSKRYDIIKGTTSVPCNEEHFNLVSRASVYAEVYNQYLLSYRRQQSNVY